MVFYLLKGKTTEEHIAEVTEGVKNVVDDVVGTLETMNQPQEGRTFLNIVALGHIIRKFSRYLIKLLFCVNFNHYDLCRVVLS